MNQRIKKLWVEALRSGEYPQGKGQLRNSDGYCCLGVLELLASKEGVVEFQPERPYLSPAVVEWAGLGNDKQRVGLNTNPHVGEDDEIHPRCGNLNDEGFDFNYIADRIEKYL